MDENILNEFSINKYKDLKLIRRDENFYLFVSGIIFGFGYLMLLVNGYYHLKSIEFFQEERQDLLVRLGFLSYAIGMLFYPTSVILNGIILWLVNERKRNEIFRKLAFSILGLIIPGILFYGEFGLDILFGTKEKWIIGILLITLSIFIPAKRRLKTQQ
ncbi:hypothetical protein [Aquimarina sp. AU119]|uniref:hypothetical protein n=1 Tax=Aquimarina sp. AU119 TaxID=2108528 RepID=UPI000D6909E4|nr:hypothetical protein [Aquimarina sp. AU119]